MPWQHLKSVWKCIKMSTNMPMIGPVVLLIACGTFNGKPCTNKKSTLVWWHPVNLRLVTLWPLNWHRRAVVITLTVLTIKMSGADNRCQDWASKDIRCHSVRRWRQTSVLPKIPKRFDVNSSSPHTVTSPTRHRSTLKNRQIVSRPDDASWIRRETLPLNQVNPVD